MSVGYLVLVFTSIVDTVPLSLSVTKRVLPSGVSTDTLGFAPTVMSGSLVLVPTSITDTVPLFQFGTKAVARHCPGAGTADARSGTAPARAPANPSTTTRGTQRIITLPCIAIPLGHRRHGVTDTAPGAAPTGMSVGSLVLVFTSIVETVSLP